MFSSSVDEGRDDLDDQYDSSGYIDDIHVSGKFPFFMIFGCASLGIFSLVSSTFLEEIFIDINCYWNNNSIWMWLNTKGSILIFFPFFSLIASEFDYSRLSAFEDFNNRQIHLRTDGNYQTIMFNSELWYYDEFITKLAHVFFKISDKLANFILDKAYLEYIYVTYVYNFLKFIHFSMYSTRYSMEKLYVYALLLLIFTVIIFYAFQLFFIWSFFFIFYYEYISFINFSFSAKENIL